MNKRMDRIRKLSKIDVLGIIFVILAFLLEAVITFKGTHFFVHSDDSTVITFAIEQWNQKKIYPDDWCYGTSIWNFGLNTLILPFLKICKHWLHARAAAVVLQTAIMLFLMWCFKKSKVLGEYFWMASLLMLLPVSEVITEHWYFQATYMTNIVFIMLFVLLTICIMKNEKVKCLLATVCLVLLLVINMEGGFIPLLIFVAPMLVTLVLYAIYRSHGQEICLKRYWLTGGVIIAGSVIGYIRNSILVQTLDMPSSGAGPYSRFIASTDMGGSLLNLWSALLKLFGASDKGQELLSLGGINKVIAAVYILIMLIIVPVCLGRNFSKIRTDSQKIFFIFSVISMLANVYIFLFTGMLRPRYLIWIYFYSIINFGILIDNRDRIYFKYIKECKIGFVLFLLVINVGCYTYYLTYDYDGNPDSLGVNDESIAYKVDYDLLAYMEEKGYTCGYSGYWASYSNMVASDGRIRMAALVGHDWLVPYYWLNSKRWYDLEDENGECFLLVPNYEMETIAEDYIENAVKTDEYHDHTIFIYDGVNVLKEIWKKYGYVE